MCKCMCVRVFIWVVGLNLEIVDYIRTTNPGKPRLFAPIINQFRSFYAYLFPTLYSYREQECFV